MRVRDLEEGDRAWVRDLVDRRWGLPVVTPVRSYPEPERLDGVVAEVDGRRSGAVTFRVDGDEWEVVTVNAVEPRLGAGRAMLEEVRRRAWAAGASRVWLITNDTNTGAIAFYERIGMRRVRVHPRFIDVVRAAKPDLPPDVFSDVIEFEWCAEDRG
jgi:GNAT superfamily N-acetyltransferase